MAGLSWSIHTLKKSKWQDGDERVSHAVFFLRRRVPSFEFITTLQRSCEGNVFNRACLSVSHSVHEEKGVSTNRAPVPAPHRPALYRFTALSLCRGPHHHRTFTRIQLGLPSPPRHVFQLLTMKHGPSESGHLTFYWNASLFHFLSY